MTQERNYPDIDAVRQLPELSSQRVPSQWEDQNGHINVSFYMALYNESGWPMMDLIGIDARYFADRKMGLFDLENHIRYLTELHVGDRVTVYGRYLDHDRKRIHGMVFVVNDDANVLASTIEFLALSVDLARRKSAAFPDDVAARLRTVTAQHQELGWTAPTCVVLPG